MNIFYLAGDVQQQLNRVPSFDYDKTVNSLHPTFKLKYIPGSSTVNFFGSIIKGVDIIGVIFLIIGFVLITWASFQDNGRWKRGGYVLTIVSWLAMIFSHFMIAGGMAYKTFFMHWRMAIMVLATQVMIYAVPIVLYYLGSSNLEFYELTSDSNFLASSQKQYRYLILLEGLAVVAYLILGVLL